MFVARPSTGNRPTKVRPLWLRVREVLRDMDKRTASARGRRVYYRWCDATWGKKHTGETRVHEML